MLNPTPDEKELVRKLQDVLAVEGDVKSEEELLAIVRRMPQGMIKSLLRRWDETFSVSQES